jgi:hypothetical protein
MKKDIHDELVQAYLDYFTINEEWSRRPSVRRYYAIRKQIKKIMILGKERHTEVRQEYLDSKEKYRNPNNSRQQKKIHK